MKTSTVGMVSTAILMIVVGVGFGIAQAAGNQSDSPAWSLQDQEAVEQYKDFLAGPIETGSLPETTQVAQSPLTDSIGENPEDQEVPQVAQLQVGSSSQYAEDRPVLSFDDEAQLRNPIETGNLPDVGNADSSIVQTEGDMYRAAEDMGGL